MPKPVSFEEVVETLDMLGDQREAFLIRETGEILLITDDDQFALDTSDTESIPEWQREHLVKLRKVLGTDQVVRFPASFDIHEWSIMERFCSSVPDPTARAILIDAVHGKGAFRMFHSTCQRFHLKESWYAYRRLAFEEIAREWLLDNNIPFE